MINTTTMMRTASLRMASAAPSKVVARPNAIRAAPRMQVAQPMRVRFNSTVPPPQHQQEPHMSKHGPMYIVLAVLLGGGFAGYTYLKPVRELARTASQAVDSVKDTTGSVASTGGSALGAVAQSFLPPGAFAIYSYVANQPGGLGGFLKTLKDKDLQGVLDQLKSAGGDDVKRVVEKIEAKVKEAGGKAQDVDWNALVNDLKGELGESGQKAIEMMSGAMPSGLNIQEMIEKAKSMGKDQLKQVEASANKVLKEVERAKKEGKGNADAFIKGLKEAAPEDVDDLVKQVKDAAKKAGLPADTIESWLKSKAENGKVDAEQFANQLSSQLKTASKFIPGNPQDLVAQVKQVSPSLANLLALAMEQAGITDKNGAKK